MVGVEPCGPVRQSSDEPPRVKTSIPDIIEFVTDPQLLGLTISPAQETLLRGIYGLTLDADQRDLWFLCTGRERYPAQGVSEATVLAGARAGKDSRIAAPIVCYEALLGQHEHRLAKGERGVIPLVAQDARASKIAFSYIGGYLTTSPVLQSQVADVLSTEVTLTNGISISCFPSTLRSLRGWSIPAAVLDEVAFFRLEGAADSDVEIQASIRRGMLAFENTRLVKISTPYMKSGILFDDFQRAFGQDDQDLLVWRAPSTLMNPSLAESRLARERRLDASRFAREYLAEFGEDVDAFLPAAWVDDAIRPGRYELPPQDRVRYHAAVDPSGGGPDAFTLAIGHAEGVGHKAKIVLDVMRGWSRRGSNAVDLTGVVSEIATILTRFRAREVVGDRYGAGWVRQAFQQAGVRYIESSNDASSALCELSPLFAEGRVDLLDHPQLARELKALERRLRAGGKTVVEHPRGGHDDHAVALALAALACRPDTRDRASASHILRAGRGQVLHSKRLDLSRIPRF